MGFRVGENGDAPLFSPIHESDEADSKLTRFIPANHVLPVTRREILAGPANQICDRDVATGALALVHGNGIQFQIFLTHVDVASGFG